MKLDPVLVALLVDQFEGVGAVAVHVSVAVGDAAIGEEERHLVHRLRPQRDEVPEHVGVLGRKTAVKMLGWFNSQKSACGVCTKASIEATV